ncbi:MAG: polyprenyl synthetase family protein, partial [Solirubrobacteraceae bacterium]
MMSSAEATLDGIVRAAGAYVPQALARVEERLVMLAAGHGPVLAAHGGDTIAAGGKRLRPLLVFVAAGAPGDGVLRAAVAVELVHSATLVHDDVLDGAQLRR